MISGEVFSFPVTILDGPDGEQNFEMARASAWQSRHKSDYDFDRLAAELTSTSQFEINLEMIHMVSYVKKVAPPGTLNIFPSQFQSAESWIRDRWIFRQNNSTSSIEPIPTFKRGLNCFPKCGIDSVHFLKIYECIL
uniref:SJCHGC07509 protein n=1 Tax=Schistosoma japonicum TaxID=6182 RepID=Q5DFF1_SCHJA|nr:SJCHGC07509 protein [Schistosoma japonicum]